MLAADVSLHNRAIILNVVALTILFVGYLLTTGTGLLDYDGLKLISRTTSLLVLLTNLCAEGKIKIKLLLIILLFSFSLLVNQSAFAANIIFLLLITANLSRLNAKELSVTLIIPIAMAVAVHLLLLASGQISIEVVQVGDRARSSLGFTNPNQIAIVYLSLVMVSVFLMTLRRQRFYFYLMLVSYILALTVFIVADSRTSLFGVIILSIFILCNQIFHKNKLWRLTVVIGGLASPIIAAAATIYITNSVGTDMDIVLSLRPYFFSEFIKTASTKDIVLGWSSLDDFPIDNLFLPLLSAVGIIICGGIIIFIVACAYRTQFKFIPLIITMMITSIFESFLLRPEIPGSILFFIILFSPLTRKSHHVG